MAPPLMPGSPAGQMSQPPGLPPSAPYPPPLPQSSLVPPFAPYVYSPWITRFCDATAATTHSLQAQCPSGCSLVLIIQAAAGGNVSSVKDNFGSPWYSTAVKNNSTGNGQASIFYAANVYGASPTITITLSGSRACMGWAIPVFGANQTLFMDGAAFHTKVAGETTAFPAVYSQSPNDIFITAYIGQGAPSATPSNTTNQAYTLPSAITGDTSANIAWSTATVAANTKGPVWGNAAGNNEGSFTIAIRSAQPSWLMIPQPLGYYGGPNRYSPYASPPLGISSAAIAPPFVYVPIGSSLPLAIMSGQWTARDYPQATASAPQATPTQIPVVAMLQMQWAPWAPRDYQVQVPATPQPAVASQPYSPVLTPWWAIEWRLRDYDPQQAEIASLLGVPLAPYVPPSQATVGAYAPWSARDYAQQQPATQSQPSRVPVSQTQPIVSVSWMLRDYGQISVSMPRVTPAPPPPFIPHPIFRWEGWSIRDYWQIASVQLQSRTPPPATGLEVYPIGFSMIRLGGTYG